MRHICLFWWICAVFVPGRKASENRIHIFHWDSVQSIRKVSLSEENRTAFGKQKAVLKVILSDCTNVAGGWRKKHYGDSIFSDL